MEYAWNPENIEFWAATLCAMYEDGKTIAGEVYLIFLSVS